MAFGPASKEAFVVFEDAIVGMVPPDAHSAMLQILFESLLAF
jgi:hypothetical protein